VIEPYIEALGYGIDDKAGYHHSGSIGEDGLYVGEGPVFSIWLIQEPGLGDDDEADGGHDSHIYGLISFFFAMVFTDDISNQEGGCKKNIAQGLGHAESVNQNQNLNIGTDGCKNGPAGKSFGTEKTVPEKNHGK